MELSKCPKCQGHVDPVKRADQTFFYFCRHCKLPFNPNGRVAVDTRNLSSAFNPTRLARVITGKGLADLSPVAKTALEALMIEGLLGAYSAGLKDGILLAYSQDVVEGGPMEKLGVSNEQLLIELQADYAKKVELVKTGSASQQDLEAIKAKIEELKK